MSDAPAPAPAAPSPPAADAPKPKKRLIPRILLLVLVLFMGRVAIRGTVAEEAAIDPKTSAEGPIRQLLWDPATEHKYSRCALVIDAPLADVKAVLSDYDKFSEIFPYLPEVKTTRDGDKYQMKGKVRTYVAGDWAFEFTIVHEESPTRFVAKWDSPSDEIPVSKGSWTATAIDPTHTLLVYALDIEVKHFPKFAVRYIVLNRIRTIVKAVDKRVLATKKP